MINFLAMVYYKVLKSVTFLKNISANRANPDEILHFVAPYLGLDARKPVYWGSVKESFKPVSSATETS